jgi:hypothetical protein
MFKAKIVSHLDQVIAPFETLAKIDTNIRSRSDSFAHIRGKSDTSHLLAPSKINHISWRRPRLITYTWKT